jgi:hypothetical protein
MKKIYAVMTYYARPRDGRATSRSGWQKEPDAVQYDEEFAIKSSVSSRDVSYAGVIIDVVGQQVIKSQFGSRDYSQLFDYVRRNYRAQLEQAAAHTGLTIPGL